MLYDTESLFYVRHLANLYHNQTSLHNVSGSIYSDCFSKQWNR